jgi:hypothetical protein
MSEIVITQMRVLMMPLGEERGHMAAKFTAQFRGLCLKECRILLRPTGELLILPPLCAGPRGNARGGLRFIDQDLWADFRTRARAAYDVAMGIDQQGEAGAGADDDGNLKSMLDLRRASFPTHQVR